MDPRYELWELLHQEHNILPTESQLDDIIESVRKILYQYEDEDEDEGEEYT